ncbi:hypothetical protein [Hyunsoonleella aestuarii]|uniref:Uncharacterized protein n=1 Tax=Hyunsoonleella aestuarii TaxID=912802 RepID=A0ABP8ECU6_9FLAO|nr:hypothetical protein [Hyunsoonleella aestuarii]
MVKIIRILKSIFFPMTLLTIITTIGIIIAINALYIRYINGSDSAIYTAVTIPIVLFLIALYVVDRFLIKKVSYFKLMIGETVFITLCYFLFLYQNRTIDVNFYTNQDYVLVLFDSEDDSLIKFNKKRVFGQEMNVYDTNIIHLNRKMFLRKDLRVNIPKQWKRFSQNRSIHKNEGDSIQYIFITRKITIGPNEIDSQTFLDSLLNKVH